MADIKVINEDTQEEEVQEVNEIKDPETQIEPDGVLLREQIARNMFDFSPSETTSYKNKLDTLIDYAKLKTDDHSPEGIKWALRDMGMKLGSPPLGEKLINYLHIYAKLYLQGHRIEMQKKRFLRGETDGK